MLFLWKYLVTMNHHNQQLQSVASNSTFNLTNAQSLQWSSNTLFLNDTASWSGRNQTIAGQFDHSSSTMRPAIKYSNTTSADKAMRSSVEYLPKPLYLMSVNESKGLIKLYGQPTFDFLQMMRSNASNSFEFLENIKEFADYQYKLTVIKFVDLVQSFVLLVLATVTLCCIFGPIVITIHKYGVLPKKQNNSYADSLSTFTLFKTGSNSQQQFVINKNAKSRSFLNPFAFNQRRKENSSLNVHSQFKQLTNSLQSPAHLQCSSATITGESSATSESSFTHTDNISNTDLTDQSPTTSHHHFHQTKKQKSTHDCESESNDEDGSMNGHRSEALAGNAGNENGGGSKLVRPPPPPLPQDFQSSNLMLNNKLSSANNKSPSQIGCGKHFNYAKTPSSTYNNNYHKSFKYVINNLVSENNLGHANHHEEHSVGHANLHANGQSKAINNPTNLHHPPPGPLNLISNAYDSSKSKPRLIRTNPLYEENQFRSAYP